MTGDELRVELRGRSDAELADGLDIVAKMAGCLMKDGQREVVEEAARRIRNRRGANGRDSRA